MTADVDLLDELSDGPSDRSRLTSAALAIVGGVVCSLLLVLALRVDILVVSLALAVVVVVVATYFALYHFEWFVMGIIAVRSSLDILHLGNVGESTLDPSAALGLMFIGTSLLWLYVQYAAGRLVKLSLATKGLLGLVAACLLSIPTSSNVLASGLTTSKILAGVLMFVVLEQLLTEPRRVRVLIVVTLVSFVVPALFGLRQMLGGEAATRVSASVRGEASLGDVSRVKGTFVHPNPFATYLVLILLFAVAMICVSRSPRWRASLATIIVTSSVLLLVTYTRVAWAAAFIGLLYLGLKLNRRILIPLGAVVLLALLVVPSVAERLSDLGGSDTRIPNVPANSLSWRLSYWEKLLPLTENHEIAGVGIGTSQYSTDEGLLPHSAFVQAYVEMGIIGELALLAMIAAFFMTLRDRIRGAPDGLERALALAAAAAAMSVLVQLPTENILGETIDYWYLAAVSTFGLGHLAGRRSAGQSGARSAS